ncbi:TonB-linked outer membrane protein, SusC/RagA family [Arenibacter palladensis]|uniref:TonB-linked outer membrane protein, SusC/RagA family n=1 Tax=Arenibacter palladensis TaxID=237373 RepID=A0A1M4UXR9_9FLAO|nr:TonB-dependent receptor [Arenibacter palladensis]SHE61524.1 TonB-linked outer membrane protein, SusC/RagA family [Arenibacter palladensis]
MKKQINEAIHLQQGIPVWKKIFVQIFFLSLFTAFSPALALNGPPKTAQQEVSGTVTDTNNMPLPGVSVVVVGTIRGTVTDFDGNFTIAVENGKQLEFSYIGMSTKRMTVSGPSLNVVMEEDSQALDEVIITGYGTQKKGEVTAAISSVDASAIERIATSSSIDAIKGQVAGVDIQADGGRPGENSTIRIRGRRSIGASNDPLYVIDGIPQISGNESVADINPQDIESMQILKDAAATAIYGSRGANGVILISTKRGRVGKTKVTYSSHIGTTSATRLVDMMDGAEFTDLKRESRRSSWNGTIPDDTAVFLDPVELKSIEEGRSTDWLDLVLNNGWQTNHQLGVSGGSENTTFNASLGYFNEQGIISNMDFERFTGRINLDHRINDIFKVGISFSISNSIQNWGSSATMGEALAINPLGVPYDDEGNLLFLPTNDGIRTNPLNELVDGAYIDERKTTRIFAPVYLDINISPELKWTTTFGPDIRYRRRGQFRGSLTNDNRGGPGDASIEHNDNFGYTLENLLTFNKSITDNQNLKVTLLQSIQKSRQENSYTAVANIPYESQQFYNMGSASVKGDITSGLVEWTLSSFMGRVNYDIDGKYLFQGSLRADGSSRLAEGNKWNYFPGFSAGWRLSQEDFLSDSNTVSDLKLRASYGEVGNTSVDPYQTAGRLEGTAYAYGETTALGFGLNEIPNSDLGWEVSKTFNVGVDYGFLNGRISGALDWFSTKTTDILLNRSLPYTSGYESILQNIGATASSGLEFNINADILTNPEGLNWDIGFNIAGLKEEITELALKDENGNSIDDVGNQWFIGSPINVFYDYEKIGIYQTSEEALANSAEGKVPGEIKLADQDGDGIITPDDRVILGSDVPDFYGGITNNFSYKGLDFSFFFYFRQGQMIRSRFHDSNNSLFGRYNNLDVDYWTIDNPSNANPRPNENQESPRNASTLSYFDGSYIKLRNVTLGYNFPKSITEKLKMSNLRLYVAGQNLFSITDYDTFDPESSETDQEDGGLSSSTIPSNKMFSLGLNVTF